MYRFLFRPSWIAFHLLVAGAVVVMVNLAFWQLRRLDERQEINRTVESRIDAPAVPIGELLAGAGADPAAIEWRPVTVSGTYLPDQVVVFNRSQDGQAGDNVLTALRSDTGTIVLVNRGFVALGSPVPAAPAGEVEVAGLVRQSQLRGRGGLTDDDAGPLTEVRRVEVERLAPQFGGDVAPVYVDLVASTPPVGTGDPRPVPAPELGNGPHLSYAIQWFVFATAAVVGWVLAVRGSVRRRRAGPLSGEPAQPAPADSPTPSAAAATSSTNRTGGPSPA